MLIVVKVAYDVIRLEMLLYICVWHVLDFSDAPILKILLCYSDVEMFMYNKRFVGGAYV